MLKTILTATAILSMITGFALAQTSSTSTTTTSTTAPVVAPPPNVTSWSESQRTTNSDGVTTDKTHTAATGASVSPNGDVTTTRKTSDATTVR
jgi:hypothetical protein